MACNFFDIALEVYMVKVSYQQKPYRRIIMENFGAEVYASPTDRTHAGRAALEQDPDNPGSLGLAISEAVEVAATSGGAKKYSLGSVLGHVLLHQTVVGEEALMQMEMAGEYPDFVIGCAGGGSNFAGFAYPFLHQNLTNGKKSKIIAVEPASCPSMTKGVYAFDWGDQAGTAPIAKMYTLGHTFIPPAEGPRRRPALSRHGPQRQRAGEPRRHRSAGGEAVGDVRGGGAVLQGRGDHPRARERACHPRGHRRSAGVQGHRAEEGHRLQPVRARPFRYDGV